MKPSDIKSEIEAIFWFTKWFKEKPVKRIGLFVLIVMLFFIFKDIHSYSKAQHLVFQIYPEVFANIKDLDKINQKVSDPSWKLTMWAHPDRYKKEVEPSFISQFYDANFTTFGKNKLDIQIRSFYINLKKYNSDYSQSDRDSLLDQGKAVLKNLNYYFGCEDFFEARKQQQNIVSGDTVIPVFSPIRYLKYKFEID